MRIPLHSIPAFAAFAGMLMVLSACSSPGPKTAEAAAGWKVDRDADGRYGFVDANGFVMIPHAYSQASPFSLGRAVVRDSGKAFLIDHLGVRRSGNFDFIESFAELPYTVADLDTLLGDSTVGWECLIDTNGRRLTGLYAQIDWDAEMGRHVFKRRDVNGGQEVERRAVYNPETGRLSPWFVGFTIMGGGPMIATCSDEPPCKTTLMDRDGALVADWYDGLEFTEHKGWIICWTEEPEGNSTRYGLMDGDGKILLPVGFRHLEHHPEAQLFHGVREAGKYPAVSYLYDHELNALPLPVEHLKAEVNEVGPLVACQLTWNTYAYYRVEAGALKMVSPEYKMVQDEAGLLAGLLDLIFRNDREESWSFPPVSQGMIRVELDGKYGYIDVEGRVKLPVQYDEAALKFDDDGIAQVRKGDDTYRINAQGVRQREQKPEEGR